MQRIMVKEEDISGIQDNKASIRQIHELLFASIIHKHGSGYSTISHKFILLVQKIIKLY